RRAYWSRLYPPADWHWVNWVGNCRGVAFCAELAMEMGVRWCLLLLRCDARWSGGCVTEGARMRSEVTGTREGVRAGGRARAVGVGVGVGVGVDGVACVRSPAGVRSVRPPLSTWSCVRWSEVTLAHPYSYSKEEEEEEVIFPPPNSNFKVHVAAITIPARLDARHAHARGAGHAYSNHNHYHYQNRTMNDMAIDEKTPDGEDGRRAIGDKGPD
ncbi:hypothetical protein EDC01DRAFT_751445, partial [Geopyxis carbonaria]